MKTSVKKIYDFLISKYPLKKAEEWDKVGHTFGDIHQMAKNVIVSLDLTPKVFEMAIFNKSSLIITHHPFIFNDDIEKDFEEAPYKRQIVERLKNTKISIISLHTNYDSNNKGTAYQVSKQLGLENLFKKTKYGYLYHHPISIGKLDTLFQKKFNFSIKDKNYYGNQIFEKWGILPGSGSPEDILKLKKIGAEFIVTSDIKWSTWQMAYAEKIILIEVSHVIEDVFTKDISNLLQKKFKNLKIIPNHIINFHNERK